MEKIWNLYKITNLINNKVYIGQAINIVKRWSNHRRAYFLNKPTQAIHFALIKYGLDNFEFEVIACCKSQDDANFLETELVTQYNSFISNNNGYNATYGGMNAPKSDEWKLALKKWRESLTPEERAEISKKQSKATLNQIEEKGHPAKGNKWTNEQRSELSKTLKALDKTKIYTEEVRNVMSESHIGIKDSEETKKNKSIKAKLAWQKRQEARLATGELKCNAPNCDVYGIAKYIFVNSIRYCSVHGQRLRNNGTFDIKPMENRNLTIGKAPGNKKHFTEIQINQIISDPRSNYKVAKDFGVTEKVIKRVREENKTINQYL